MTEDKPMEEAPEMYAEHMEFMKLVPKTHPLLKQKLTDFDFDNYPLIEGTTMSMTPQIASHILHEVMIRENGLGLSANQVGMPWNVFVMNTSPKLTCFNPKIVSCSDDMVVMEEGCLTYPLLFVKIRRPSSIRVRFQDVDGETHTEVFKGVTARVFQHEWDHVNGINFLSRTSKLSLDRARKKQKIFMRRKKSNQIKGSA